jgi:hypothetical protein
MGLPGLLRSPALLPVRVTVAAATVGLGLVTVPVRVGRDMLPVRAAESAARALGEIAGGTPRRRCWSRDGRMWIEIRGVEHPADLAALRDAVSAEAGSLLVFAAVVSTPGVSQLLGSTPLGPVGWAQALSTAAVATTIAALAPRLATRGSSRDSGERSTTFTTPTRQSTAYSSRNGSASRRDIASVNGSAPYTSSRDTPLTVDNAFVQTPNST